MIEDVGEIGEHVVRFILKLHVVFFLLNSVVPAFAVEWESLRNDSVRVFYAKKNYNLALAVLSQTDQKLAELTSLLGLPFSGEVNIFLASDKRVWNDLTRNRIPDWSEAVTRSKSGIIYLKTRPSGGKSFSMVLSHELVHVLLGKNFSGRKIPRWFEEGTAMMFSGEHFSDYVSILSRANVTHSLLRFDEIEELLRFQRSKANLAYAQSFLGVKMIVDALGWQAVREIFSLMQGERTWKEAFETVLEMNLERFQDRLSEEVDKKYRWNFIFQSDVAIWVLLPFLAMLVYIFIRVRNYRTYRRWEEEEKFTRWDPDDDDNPSEE